MVLLSSFNTAKSSHRFQTPKGKGYPPTTWCSLVDVIFSFYVKLSTVLLPQMCHTQLGTDGCAACSKRTAIEPLCKNENRYINKQPIECGSLVCMTFLKSEFFRIVTKFYLQKGKIIIKKIQNLKPSSFLAFIPSLLQKAPSTTDTFSVSWVQKLECSGNTYKEKEFLDVHYITKRFAPRPKEGGILSNIKFL